MNKLIFTSLLFLLLITGCNQNDPHHESRLSLVKVTNPSPVQINSKTKSQTVEEIKKSVSRFPELYDVAVVKGKEDTLVVYKVRHLERFRMKQIEKNITKQLEKKFPKENFTVSSDYKIFMEALELKKKVEEQHYSQSEAEKELKKIITLKEELT